MGRYVGPGGVDDPSGDVAGGEVECDLWSASGPRYDEWGGSLSGRLDWAALTGSDRVLLVLVGHTGRILVDRVVDDRAEIIGLGDPPF